MQDKKLISFTIPCYNSAEYMDHCIQSILDGCEANLDAIEILIIDDGSYNDNTADKADDWQERYPGIIRAVHQENAGHGGAVNSGLALAQGMYFKVVDSDDWLDVESMKVMLELVELFSKRSNPVDLILANYVYENEQRGQEVVDYKGILPVGTVFGWEQAGYFPPWRFILMHSVMYRTQVLRDSGVRLPKHTFYVDNVFVYVPLPYVKTIFYMDLDLYRYFIGRDDQSVNEKIMVSRIEQQLRVTREMIDAYDLAKDVENKPLRDYMESYLRMMMIICSMFSMLADRPDKFKLRADIWTYLERNNPGIYSHMRHSALGRLVNLPGDRGGAVMTALYHLTQKVFKFN